MLNHKGTQAIKTERLLLRKIKESDYKDMYVFTVKEDVAKYVDRIIVMDHGCMKFDGEPKKVFEHYKELESIGLAAPQVTYVMQTLKEKGFDVDVHAITIEEAKQFILHAFGMEDRRVTHD